MSMLNTHPALAVVAVAAAVWVAVALASHAWHTIKFHLLRKGGPAMPPRFD